MLDTVDEDNLEPSDVIHCHRRSGRGQGCPNTGITAEIRVVEGVACQLIKAARSLFTVYIGILQELRCDSYAISDHVQVSRGGVVIDAQSILFHTPAGRGQPIVQVGIRRRNQWGGNGRLQASTRFGKGFADPDGDRLTVGAQPIPKPGAQRLPEFPFQKALLDNWLQGGRKILNTHV